MAETRKHRTTVRDALDQAILAALGENVQPVMPGGDDPFDGTQAPVETDEALRPGYIPPATSLGSVILPPEDPFTPTSTD